MKRIQKLAHNKLGLAVLVVMFLAIGCQKSGGKAKPVTLKIWKPFVDSGQIQPLLSAYQALHSNVQFEYTEKNIENYEADLLDALASGNGPDIFSINNSWLPKYLDKTAPAKDTVFTFKDYRDTFVDIVAQNFTKDSKIYGTALSVDSMALYYNKDILGTVGIATPPKTWDELAVDVRQITRQDQTGYFMRSGVAIGTSSNVNRPADILYLLMLQDGVIPWSSDGLSPTFAQGIQKNGNYVNAGEEALTFYTSFANPASANYTWNARSDYSIDAFANGRAAMLYSYGYARELIEAKAPNLNYDVAPVPQENLDDPAVNYANYFGEVVNKQSANADVAWDFLKFITSKDQLDKFYAANPQASSRKDLVEKQINDPEIGVFAHANLTAKTFYKPDEKKQDAIFANMIDNVVLKGMRVSDALGQAQSQAQTITRVRN
jgi:ABC-type glycerol-3-phosphate transport system substrate-binding protein